MPTLIESDTTRKAISGELRRVHIKVSRLFLERMDAFRKEVRLHCDKRMTRSFLFREGSRMLMRHFRKELDKAKLGELHAKKR